MSSDAKGLTAALSGSLVIEVVAGTPGKSGKEDGALSRSLFNGPFGLCAFGDSLFVTDQYDGTIRQVTGVLGVANPLGESADDTDAAATGSVSPSEVEARAVPLLMAAIPALPKELARLMAQYARPNGRVTTIAGMAGKLNHVDGRALGESQFWYPSAVALDTSDVVAGPRLIIVEFGSGHCVRCLTFRTGLVTTIAGSIGVAGYVDGPVSAAQFHAIWGLTVLPNGAVLVVEETGKAVRRISPAPATSRAERMVTTLIGRREGDGTRSVVYAHSSAECFRQPLEWPRALAVHLAPDEQSGDADRDVGRLFVGSLSQVDAFDLMRGERKCFALAPDDGQASSIAVTADGARLFAANEDTVHMIDLRTGTCTALVSRSSPGDGPLWFRAGAVTNDGRTTSRLQQTAAGCVIDQATHSLVICDYGAHCLVRLRGVDV